MKSHFSTLLLALGLTLAANLTPAQQPPADPFAALPKYQFGQSRLPLALIDEQIRKSTPADYKAIEAKLLPILQAPETTKDAKRFICRWLTVVGSAECVAAVAPLLTDDDLSHPARMALEPMTDPAAGAALRAALPKAKGKVLVGIISSLGIRRDGQAVGALSGLIRDADPLVAGTALAALGEIGPAAAQVLNTAAVPETLARTLARARIAAAGYLAQSGAGPQAAEMFKNLMSPQHPQAIRIAALKGQIGALPQADATTLILEMLQGEDAAMRSATISAYTSSSDLALKNTVAAKLPSMKPAGQLILLGVLADQPDVAARAPVLEVLAAGGEDNLRCAALECLVRHGEAADVPRIAALANDKSAAVADAARRTLQRLGKPGTDDALVRLIESPDASLRAVTLATLANRRVESALPTLVRLLSGSDAALATEAAKALGVMGKSDQLADLAKILATTENAALRSATEEAVKSVCRRTPDKSAAAAVLVASLNQAPATPARVSLLQTLIYTGGESALNTVLKAMQDNQPEVRAAATKALIAWPEAAAGAPLLALARNATDPNQAIVVLRDGCLRLADSDELSLSHRLDILRGVLDVAQRPEEKRRAISTLAEMPSLGAMQLLQGAVKDPALQNDAVKAAAKLGRQLAAVYNRQIVAALQDIKAQLPTDEARQPIENALKAAQNAGQSPDGFVIAWMLSGPYTEEGKDGNALFDIAFAPEKPNAQAEWRPIAGAKSGLVELDKVMRGDNRVAYLRTQITADKTQDALLEMGSDDGIKVWLNGQVVHANNSVRPCTPGSDKAKIKLKQGANDLLLKITQGAGEWSACCRVRGPNGQELTDVTVAPNAP